jgi:hypothetical protein
LLWIDYLADLIKSYNPKCDVRGVVDSAVYFDTEGMHDKRHNFRDRLKGLT